jgi:hypothetical protein
MVAAEGQRNQHQKQHDLPTGSGGILHLRGNQPVRREMDRQRPPLNKPLFIASEQTEYSCASGFAAQAQHPFKS